MRDVFADTAGWAHLLDSSQIHHEKAVSVYRAVQQGQKQLVTTNYVLTELVALFQSPLRLPRARIVQLIGGIKSSRFVRVVHVDESLDAEAWQLLSERLDKNWSLVDCSSFKIMQREGLLEALTTDQHFQQAGFVRMLE